MNYALTWEIWLILKMQDMADCLIPVMKFFTCLGNPEAYLIFIALVYWSVDRKLGLRLAIFLPFVVSLNSILKQAVHAPRPYWVDPNIDAIKVANGFGMPSGHAQASTIYLYAANCLKRGWIWLVTIAVVFMVGWSRVYLGVHFATQVLAGWMIGIVVLILFARYEKNVLRWFLDLAFGKQLLWLVGISILILILGGFFVYLLKDWEMPLEWIQNSSDDLACKKETICSSVGIGNVAGSAGVFLGVSLGALLLHKRGGFDTRGTVREHVFRNLIGIPMALVLFVIIMLLKPDDSREFLYAIWRFCGFFAISFLIIFLLPRAFRRLRLLSSENQPLQDMQ